MSTWTWVLTGLLIAGVLLPLIGAAVVVRLLLRMRSRTAQLRHSRLFTSLESLQLQNAHMQQIAKRAAPLVQRAQSAIETLRSSPYAAGLPQMRDSLQTAGVEMSELFIALR
ncbi:MAG TPA: hypothetical protein VKT72_17270 [Candidatus Baltobacteraceae bacterium]|nr:hypothetical protein [Candidatus Baltobacteraceae bacterium]